MRTVKVSNFILVMTLLALSAASTIACEHLALGVPKQSDMVDCRLSYAIGYDNERRSAEWVAYKLHHNDSINVARTEDFRSDPMISSQYQTGPKDYDEPVYSQGHLANSESVGISVLAMSETFLMSNIVPQLPTHNRGIWKGLENRERKWSISHSGVFVYAGVLYEGPVKSIGHSRVPVPSHFWKVIYSPRDNEAIAYLIEHKPLYTKDLDTYLTSIDEIESRAGLDLLSLLADEQESLIESFVQPKQWK